MPTPPDTLEERAARAVLMIAEVRADNDRLRAELHHVQRWAVILLLWALWATMLAAAGWIV